MAKGRTGGIAPNIFFRILRQGRALPHIAAAKPQPPSYIALAPLRLRPQPLN